MHVTSRYHAPARLLVAVAGLCLLAACARNTTSNDPAVEVLEEIDAYRTSEPTHRSLSYARSDNPDYVTIDDTVTTAAVQFDGPIVRIQLSDVLLTTLKNNRAIRIEDYERSIAESGVMAARGIYDLLISASWQYSQDEAQVPVRSTNLDDPASTRNRSRTLFVSLQQLLPTGGVLELAAQHARVKTYQAEPNIDPYDATEVSVGIVQPLLRGFGPYVTNAGIRIARIEEDIAREGFRGRVIEQLAAAVNTYWDLVFAIDNYEVQRLSLKRAQELLRVATIKRDTGVEPPNVVTQAEAEVARREAFVIDAQRQISDVADALKRAMNITEDSEQWRYNLIPLDRPGYAPLALNEQAIYSEALAFRPDYRSAKLGLDIAEINRRVAKNRMLPRLDASASYHITGLDEDFDQSADWIETNDYNGYGVGLTLSYPLQNRAARGRYHQAREGENQVEETLRQLEEVIRLEVRRTIRAIETSQKLVGAWDAAVKAERAKLDSQIKRYDVGLATIFEVLNFQEDLAEAQVNYLEAIIGFNKALIEMQRVKASFLQDYRMEFLDRPVEERLAGESIDE